jgi:hypothetical protein
MNVYNVACIYIYKQKITLKLKFSLETKFSND